MELDTSVSDSVEVDRMAVWTGLLVLSAVCSLLYGCGEVRNQGQALVKSCRTSDPDQGCGIEQDPVRLEAFFSRDLSTMGESGLVAWFELALGSENHEESRDAALLWLDMDLAGPSLTDGGEISGKSLLPRLLLITGSRRGKLFIGTGKVFVHKLDRAGGPVPYIKAGFDLFFKDDEQGSWVIQGELQALERGYDIAADDQRDTADYYYQEGAYCPGCYGCGGVYYVQGSQDDSSGSGCEADDTSDSGDSGCQGDDMSDYDGSGGTGCEGDDHSSNGCEGDANAASPGSAHQHGKRHGISLPGVARLLAPGLLGLLIKLRKRRGP